jgi:hypothetical protein
MATIFPSMPGLIPKGYVAYRPEFLIGNEMFSFEPVLNLVYFLFRILKVPDLLLIEIKNDIVAGKLREPYTAVCGEYQVPPSIFVFFTNHCCSPPQKAAPAPSTPTAWLGLYIPNRSSDRT